MHVGIANPCWRGKRSRHSQRMRNPQFYVSGKRSMEALSTLLTPWEENDQMVDSLHKLELEHSPDKGTVMRTFDFFIVTSLNTSLNKQLSCQWFVMSWHLIWPYCDDSSYPDQCLHFPLPQPPAQTTFHGLWPPWLRPSSEQSGWRCLVTWKPIDVCVENYAHHWVLLNQVVLTSS